MLYISIAPSPPLAVGLPGAGHQAGPGRGRETGRFETAEEGARPGGGRRQHPPPASGPDISRTDTLQLKREAGRFFSVFTSCQTPGGQPVCQTPKCPVTQTNNRETKPFHFLDRPSTQASMSSVYFSTKMRFKVNRLFLGGEMRTQFFSKHE